jgi:hypothetical protein
LRALRRGGERVRERSALNGRVVEIANNHQPSLIRISRTVVIIYSNRELLVSVVGTVVDGVHVRLAVCVLVCVLNRRSAHSASFHRVALGFHTHVAVPLQHLDGSHAGLAADGPTFVTLPRFLRRLESKEIAVE